MKKQNETPRYATLLYSVRKELDISLNEYFYLDMVYHLSYKGWCYKSLANCADDMGITKQGLILIRKKLIDRGLLKTNLRGHSKVTSKYTSVAVNKVYQHNEMAVKKVYGAVKKVYPSGKQSYNKNNNRVTKDNRGLKSKNKERIKEALKTGNWELLKKT